MPSTPEQRGGKENQDLSSEKICKRKSEICKKVDDYDAHEKALTGRTPEDIEIDTGIKKERLFPEDKKILYVGDPYQVMGKIIDNPNFTTIDYEFGEQVQFIFNEKRFRGYTVAEGRSLADTLENPTLTRYIETYSGPHQDLLRSVLPRLQAACDMAEKAPLVHDDPEHYRVKYPVYQDKILRIFEV